MFYGIYVDSDGDHRQVIGEASWLMARTCFPDDDLNGATGHTDVDVTCMFILETFIWLLLTSQRYLIHRQGFCAPEERSQR